MDSYLDHLAVERGAARNTLGSYRRDLERYTQFLADREVTDIGRIREQDVSDFVIALRAGDQARELPPLAASSAARALIAVRGFHRFAAAEGMTAVDVARDVRPPSPAKRLPKSLPVNEVLALLEAVGGSGPADGPRAVRDRALLELLYSTGARISEAVGLDVDDVDTETRSVLLRGEGGQAAGGPGGPARRRIPRRLPDPGPAGTGFTRNTRAVPQCPRRTAVPPERVEGAADRGGRGGHLVGGVAAHTPSLVRDPPARRRRRRQGRPGAAGTCLGDDHPDIYAGDSGCAARGVGRSAPPGKVTESVSRGKFTVRGGSVRITMWDRQRSSREQGIIGPW
ncbi:Tyrosine recombinase xerD [Rhodococcus opacus PD630]|nr:Tyrosine recombinase xerD [Rhodococcus opacus PD630]